MRGLLDERVPKANQRSQSSYEKDGTQRRNVGGDRGDLPRTLSRISVGGRSSFPATGIRMGCFRPPGRSSHVAVPVAPGCGAAHSAGPFSQEWAVASRRTHSPPEDLLDWGSCESCRLSAKTRQGSVGSGKGRNIDSQRTSSSVGRSSCASAVTVSCRIRCYGSLTNCTGSAPVCSAKASRLASLSPPRPRSICAPFSPGIPSGFWTKSM